MNRGLCVVLACALAGCEARSQAMQSTQPATAETSALLWAAFECSAFAAMAGNSKEQERLFTLGFENGRRFVEASKARKISQADFQKTVPMGVAARMGGPSTDFIVGTIYEAAERHAQDRVGKEDHMGMPLPIKDWLMDPEARQIRAQGELRSRNCGLLK